MGTNNAVVLVCNGHVWIEIVLVRVGIEEMHITRLNRTDGWTVGKWLPEEHVQLILWSLSINKDILMSVFNAQLKRRDLHREV